jgi:hypothetical protein
MSRHLFNVTCAFGICFLTHGYCDGEPAVAALSSSIEPVEIHGAPSHLEEGTLVQTREETPLAAIVERPFSPFTGKIKGKKVRLRAQADVESRIVQELSRNDMVVVLGEKGDFYAVEPPPGLKAYVFRTFVLDGIVEGNRVNVRLEPSLDSPVVGHLSNGDKIKGAISSLNNKWYEIAPPPGVRFYVSKEFVDSIGGPEVKAQIDKRRTAAEQLFDSALLLTQVEMKKSFKEMEIDRIRHNYQTVMNDFTEFPDLCDKAKEAFNVLQEEYTQRKIAYLEEKAEGKVEGQEEHKLEVAINPTDRMKMWDPIEESLYLTWAARHDDRSIEEFYDEQKQNGEMLTGIVEPYSAPVKRKPGDFILKEKDLPVAYIYSTQLNLQDFVGKKVTLVGTKRENNNFAFPAYFVLAVE